MRTVLNNDSFRRDPDLFSDEQELNACGATDRGRVRESNQDQFLIAQLNKSMRVLATSLTLDQRLYGTIQGEVLLVADGMGGHAAGEKASRLAIGHLVRRLLCSIHWHFQGEEENEPTFINDLQELLKDAHTRILLESAQNADQRGMGTTLTMAYLVWPSLYVVHAGDSRCYLVREGIAEQLTTDHTLARQMVESGGMKPEDEAKSKWSNVLWNVLGGRADGELIAEVRRIDLQYGDAIVLCSDGLHRYIHVTELAKVVTDCEAPDQACHRLINLANEAGGEDNITVVVSFPAGDDPNRSTWIDVSDTSLPPEPNSSRKSKRDPVSGTNQGDSDPLADTLPG